MKEINTSQLVDFGNGQAITTSLQVAEYFGKEHRHVLRAIDQIQQDMGLPKIGQTQIDNLNNNMFKNTTYIHSQNHQEYRMVILNRKGFMMLASGFTGKLATKLKSEYFDTFDAMEKYIREQEQNQFFLPETPDQQLKREKLAISQQRANTAQSREIRAWINMMKDSDQIIERAAPKVLSELLDIPETRLLGEV